MKPSWFLSQVFRSAFRSGGISSLVQKGLVAIAGSGDDSEIRMTEAGIAELHDVGHKFSKIVIPPEGRPSPPPEVQPAAQPASRIDVGAQAYERANGKRWCVTAVAPGYITLVSYASGVSVTYAPAEFRQDFEVRS